MAVRKRPNGMFSFSFQRSREKSKEQQQTECSALLGPTLLQSPLEWAYRLNAMIMKHQEWEMETEMEKDR